MTIILLLYWCITSILTFGMLLSYNEPISKTLLISALILSLSCGWLIIPLIILETLYYYIISKII